MYIIGGQPTGVEVDATTPALDAGFTTEVRSRGVSRGCTGPATHVVNIDHDRPPDGADAALELSSTVCTTAA